jgi:hypothetical protein
LSFTEYTTVFDAGGVTLTIGVGEAEGETVAVGTGEPLGIGEPVGCDIGTCCE